MRWSKLGSALLVALLATGCGKEGEPANGTTVQVSVSPLAVIAVVNGTQAFSAVVSGVKGIAIAASNGAVRASNVVTITTTVAHGYSAGQLVTISGVTDTSFSGTFPIASVPSATTFTYAQAAADATSGGGTAANNSVKWFVDDVEGGNTTVGTITTGGLYTAPATLPPPVTATIAANGVKRASNVVTITTTAAHNFLVGQTVVISGVTDTSFNDTFSVASVPSTTTFTFSQTGSDATSTGGTVTSYAVKIKAVSVADASASATVVVSIDSGISVQVTPLWATVGTEENFQFFATVLGSSNTVVDWLVNGVAGGNSSVGTISSNGLYTAPAVPPSSNTATIAANGAVRASNVVTITTTAAHGFQVNQGVVIAGVADASFNGTFTIKAVPTTSTFTYDQTGSNATSGGGTATSASSAVTIKAISVADPTRSDSVAAIVQVAADPTLTSINPTTAPQGALFQDVFLTGTNFISTSAVRVNDVPLPTAAVSWASGTLIRARIPESLLAAPGVLAIDVRRQNGVTTPPQNLTVVSVRPAVVGASPDSGTQGGAAFSFNVNGGYFSPSVTAEFNGSIRSATLTSSRQLGVTIDASDLATPGLFPVVVRNTAAAQPIAAMNLAVQSSPSVNPPGVVATVPVGVQPVAVAVNPATGVAVVVNRGSDSVSLLDLATNTLIGSVTVGSSPTGVAIDSERNLALVANNGSDTLSVIDLASGTVVATISDVGTKPFAVGVNPLTGLALVTYQNSNRADIFTLAQTPPAIVSTTTISTGGNPQVAVNPQLNWAVATPGGAGTLSIVDLSRRVSASIAASNGASRASGVTTITTTTSHSFQTSQAVLIAGVADASFNGVFTITSTPSSTTFTYVQAGASNATSGGGYGVTTPPVATAAIGLNTRGIGISTHTQRAILADPTSTSVVLFNLFDQVVTSVTLGEMGAAAAAFNSLTDIAVTANPNTNQVSVIDPRTPARLATVAVGASPRAVAIDAATNVAVVANEGSNDVSILSLGAIRALHVMQINPITTFTSATDVTVNITGSGFDGGSVVRLDETPVPTTFVSPRCLVATVPAAMLSQARHFALDVENPGMVYSNVSGFAVIQPVTVGTAPRGVALDPERNLAVVTNSGSNDVSLIDLATGAVSTVAVGTNPQGVDVLPRLGKAVVANRGSSNVSIVDLVAGTVTATATVGTEPIGVTINHDTGRALVANSASQTLTVVKVDDGQVVTTITVDVRPVAIAIAPQRNLAAVAHATQNNLALLSLAEEKIIGRVPNVPMPTGVIYDPATDCFVVVSSLGNNLMIVNPDTIQGTPVRIGINPTSIAYNFNSSMLVTVNSASQSVSVMDFLERRVRAVLRLQGSEQFSVAIHPSTNLAVVADESNNRVLLVPLPR